MNIFIELGKFLISTTVLGGLIIWLFQKMISIKLSTDLERFKLELQHSLDKEKFKFTKLHEETALLLKALYTEFYSINKQLIEINKIVDRDNYDSVKIDNLFNKIIEVEDYYKKNRILLNENLCDKIDELFDSYLDSMKNAAIIFLTRDSNTNELQDRFNENRLSLNVAIDNKIPEIQHEIENNFRNLIGVEL
jgi:hypothetical protein